MVYWFAMDESRHVDRLRPRENLRAGAVSLASVSIVFQLADRLTYRAVERASLAVADGEFVSIVGPTGCGKSTTLALISGLEPPSIGTVRVLGARFQRCKVTVLRDKLLQSAAHEEGIGFLPMGRSWWEAPIMKAVKLWNTATWRRGSPRRAA